ncbi:MAG: dihydrodipicolinate synthase family protein [Candidatus Omnitrophica bacterium]|nr:dihydrodipicolinate synthase family protein [Candidatus Omnitrophota bacterium]
MKNQELIKKVTGEIVPLPAQYNDDLSLSLEKMKEHLDFLLGKGVKNIYLALSASEFEAMTTEERLKVTEMAVKQAKAKATILAQPVGDRWFRGQAKEAKAMVELGADILVVKLMDLKDSQKFFSSSYRRNGYKPKHHEDFFVDVIRQIGKISGGKIILHDKPFRSFDYLDKIVSLDCVVGIKTHEEDPYKRHELYSRYGSDYICFDGMGKTNQFWSLTWGACARHSCWSWFDPVTDQKFTRAVKSGEHKEALAIIDKEWPVVDAILSTGFAGYKEIMRLVGLPSSSVRIAGSDISSQEKEMIKKAAIKSGLLKQSLAVNA